MNDMQTTLDKWREKPIDKKRERLKTIAEGTLAAIEDGFFVVKDVRHDISAALTLSVPRTKYFAPDSLLSMWATMRPVSPTVHTGISVVEISSIDGIRLLSNGVHNTARAALRIGVLNFASATKPGGGFLNGAQAQEESLARSSTLYPTLTSPTAEAFYMLHDDDPKDGFYSHAMIFSPGVIFFRDDAGQWTKPCTADVLTCAAVNARAVSKHSDDSDSASSRIARIMRERMARILYLFERQGVRKVVLGSFGTGVFGNDVALVAGIWRELLTADRARFRQSFTEIVFAILGRETYSTFRRVFQTVDDTRTT